MRCVDRRVMVMVMGIAMIMLTMCLLLGPLIIVRLRNPAED